MLTFFTSIENSPRYVDLSTEMFLRIQNQLDFVDFPLHSLYKCKGKSSKSADFGLLGKFQTQIANPRHNFSSTALRGYSELGGPPQHPTSHIMHVLSIHNRPTRPGSRWVRFNRS